VARVLLTTGQQDFLWCEPSFSEGARVVELAEIFRPDVPIIDLDDDADTPDDIEQYVARRLRAEGRGAMSVHQLATKLAGLGQHETALAPAPGAEAVDTFRVLTRDADHRARLVDGQPDRTSRLVEPHPGADQRRGRVDHSACLEAVEEPLAAHEGELLADWIRAGNWQESARSARRSRGRAAAGDRRDRRTHQPGPGARPATRHPARDPAPTHPDLSGRVRQVPQRP